jgi:hypothetical protein
MSRDIMLLVVLVEVVLAQLALDAVHQGLPARLELIDNNNGKPRDSWV